MTVRVWLLHTDEPPAVVEEISHGLSPDERDRCAQLAPEVRAEFVLCRRALRELLAEATDRAPSSLDFRPGSHGKPALADAAIEFNLSHSDGLAAIAIAERPVGIDIQQQRTGPGLGRMAERYFSALEASWLGAAPDSEELGRRFSRLWSRKEACAKVTGGRLIPTLAREVSTFGNGTFGWTEPAVTGRDLAVPAGHHGAVAQAGSDSFDVHLAWWSPASPLNPGVLMAGTSC